MLTRITEQKVPCVYIHVHRITKHLGPGPYNSLCHADDITYLVRGSYTPAPFSRSTPFVEIQDVPTFHRSIRKKKYCITYVTNLHIISTLKVS